MVILQLIAWFVFSCVLMSFIEHQVHEKLMHKKNFLSERFATFKHVYEAHAIVHHGQYSKIYTDEPVPPGQDKEIRLTPWKGAIKASPFTALIALFSLEGAAIFTATVVLHHWVWNKIHLEMHKPEGRGFSRWPVYKFLARFHYLHHCHPFQNLNVVFPLADYILGTNVKKASPDEIQAMNDLGYYNSISKAQLKKQRELAGIK
jgi:hypothetical protein